MTAEYIFPKLHAFPPLYTKQPNTTVLTNQLDSWCNIILSYCEHYKITALSIRGEPLHSQDDSLDFSSLPPLFENNEINRTANDEFRLLVFKHLIHKLNKAEYIDTKMPEAGLLIYWRSLTDWANLLYSHVNSTGQLGSVLTIYELTKLEDSTLPLELRNLGEELLIKMVKEVLVKRGKAQLLMNENNEIGGVKIV